MRNQSQDEIFDKYVTELKILALHVDVDCELA
jgi:hypothetical protein